MLKKLLPFWKTTTHFSIKKKKKKGGGGLIICPGLGESDGDLPRDKKKQTRNFLVFGCHIFSKSKVNARDFEALLTKK